MILKSAAVLLLLAAIVAGKNCLSKKSSSKLFCYYGKSEDVDTCKCSHVILPSDSDVKSIEGLRDKLSGSKILLTVNEFNEGLIKTLKTTKVDGLEINLKKLDSRNDISDFISTVRSKLGSDLYLALSVPPKTETLAKYYDFKSLSKNADVFILQTHLLGVSKNVTFHPSRLSGLWDVQNTDSVVDLVSGLGAPLSKLVITAPVQGFKFKLQNEKHTAPGSPAIELSTLTRDELCEKMSSDKWMLERDQDQAGPYIFRNNEWISFEDSMSMDIKAKYSRVRGLAGLALKDLSQDGGSICGESLLESAYSGLSKQARAPRGAVLHSLEREILQTPSKILDNVQVSPYRISRVIDVEGKVHIIRQDTRTEFACSRQGYFVHPRSCGRFYRCVKFDQLSDEFSVFEFDCPAGLAFDERVEVCVWPGSLPHASACSGSSEIAPVPKERFICPGEQGYYADPENCRWFFACLDHGKSPLSAYEFRCPYGLVFDEERLMCEWSWLVPKCASGYASGSIHGEEYHYGGLQSNALDVYDGIGSISGIKLGGLSGPLVQPIQKTYSSLNTGRQIVANIFGVQPQITLAAGNNNGFGANANGHQVKIFGNNNGFVVSGVTGHYDASGNDHYDGSGNAHHTGSGNAHYDGSGNANGIAASHSNGFGGSGVYIARSGNQYGQSKLSLEGQTDHSLGYHAGADSAIYNSGNYRNDQSDSLGSYKHDTSGDYNSQENHKLSGGSSLVLDNSAGYKHDDSGSYKHDTSGNYNSANAGAYIVSGNNYAYGNDNTDNSRSYKHDSSGDYNSQKSGVYTVGLNGNLATYASGNAYYSGSDTSGSYKNDASGTYSSQLLGNSENLNIHHLGSYNYVNSKSSGSDNSESYKDHSGSYIAGNAGSYVNGNSGSRSSGSDHSGSYKDHSGNYIAGNTGSYVIGNSGSGNSESNYFGNYKDHSGSYIAGHAGSYVIGNSGSESSGSGHSGSYKDQSGSYVAGNTGSYVIGKSGSGSSGNDNFGSYKDHSGSYIAGHAGSFVIGNSRSESSGSDHSGNFKDHSGSYITGDTGSYIIQNSGSESSGSVNSGSYIAGNTESYVAGNSGVNVAVLNRNSGIYSSGDAVSHSYQHSTSHDASGSYKEDNSGAYVADNSGDYVADNSGNYKEENGQNFNSANVVSFNVKNQNSNSYTADNSGRFVAGNSGEYSAENSGSYKGDTSGSYNSVNSESYNVESAQFGPGSYKADNSGSYVAGKSGVYNTEHSGSYKGDNSGSYNSAIGGSYNIETSHSGSGSYNHDNSGSYVSGNVENYVVGGSGSYNVDNSGSYKEENSKSSVVKNTESYIGGNAGIYKEQNIAKHVGPSSSYSSYTSNDHANSHNTQGQLGQVNIVAGGSSGVALTKGVEIIQHGINLGGVEHITPLPTVSSTIPSVTSVPLPSNSGLEFFNGGVVANIPDLQFKLEHPSTINSYLGNYETYKEAKANDLGFVNYTRFVSSTQTPLVIKSDVISSGFDIIKLDQQKVKQQKVGENGGYVYQKPSVVFEEKPKTIIQTVTVKPTITYQEYKPVVNVVHEVKPAVTYQQVNVQHKQEHQHQKQENVEEYHYEKPAVVFEEKLAVTEGYHYKKPSVVFEEKPIIFENKPAVTFQEVKHEATGGYHYDKPAVVFKENPQVSTYLPPVTSTESPKYLPPVQSIYLPAVSSTPATYLPPVSPTIYLLPSSTPKPTAVYRYNYAKHNTYVFPSNPIQGHKFGVIESQSYHNRQNGYHYEKPTIVSEEQPKAPVQPAVAYQEVEHKATGGYHYEKPAVVFEEKPVIKPEVHQHLAFNYGQKTEHKSKNYQEVKEQKFGGYHYEKPAVIFEERPSKSIVFEEKPAVTYQHFNVQHKQEHQQQEKLEGYHYEKPAIVFEEKPEVKEEYHYEKPAIPFEEKYQFRQNEQEHKEQHSISYQNVKHEGYHYEKPAVAFEENPALAVVQQKVTYQPAVTVHQPTVTYHHEYKPAVIVPEVKPAVTYQEYKPVVNVAQEIKPALTYQHVNVQHKQEHQYQKQEDVEHKYESYHYVKPAVVFEEATQKPTVDYQEINEQHKQEGYSYVNHKNVEHKEARFEGYHYEKPTIAFKEKSVIQPTVTYQEYKPFVTIQEANPSVTYQEINYKHKQEHQHQKQEHVEHKFEGYHYEKPAVVFKEAAQKTVLEAKPAVTYQEINFKHEQEHQLQQQEHFKHKFEGYHYEKPAVVFEEATQKTLQQPVILEQRPTYKEIVTKVSKPAVISSFSIQQPVQKIIHEEEKLYLPPVQSTQTYLPVHEEKKVYLPPVQPTREYLPVEPVKTYIPQEEPKLEYIPAVPTTSRPIVRYEFSSLDKKYAPQPQPTVEYLPVPEPTIKVEPVKTYIPQPQPTLEYLPAHKHSFNKVVHEEKKAYLPSAQPTREYLPVEPVKTYILQEEPKLEHIPAPEPTLEYLPVPKPTLEYLPVTQKPKQNVVVESYFDSNDYNEQEEISEEPIVAKKTFLTYQQPQTSSGYDYPKPEIKFEEGIKIDNYKNYGEEKVEIVSTTSKPIVKYEFSSFDENYNNYEIQKQDYVPLTTLRPAVTSPRRKYKLTSPKTHLPVTTPLERVYLPVTTESYIEIPVSEEIYKIEPSKEYLPVRTAKPNREYLSVTTPKINKEYLPVTTVKPNKEYLPVTKPSREYLPVTTLRSRSRKPTTEPSKVYLSVTSEKPSREYLPVRSRTRKPSREYLPVTSEKTYTVRSRTRKPSKEYLPVASTQPSKEYLPIKENLSVERTPKPNSKMIIKVNDFHPVLSAKLGAQCTCTSNTLILRKKSKQLNNNNDDERENYPVGYVIKDDDDNKSRNRNNNYDDNYDNNKDFDINDGEELDLPKTDIVVEDFKYVPGRFSSTTEAVYIEEPSSEVIDLFINKARKQSVRVIKKKKPNSVKIIDSNVEDNIDIKEEIKNGVKKGIKEGLKEGIEESIKEGTRKGFKEGFKEGVEVAIQSKDFDRYGPGGVRGRTETLQGTIDCQRAGLFRHPKHCNKFYACRWDCDKKKFTLHVFNCPVHLTFDNNLGACNWPSQGPACVDDTLLPTV